MKLERLTAGRLAAFIVASCGCATGVLAQTSRTPVLPTPRQTSAPAARPMPRPAAARPQTVPAPGPVYTRPQPRLIVEPGKPMIFTSVPQLLGEVPVAITRAPRPTIPWNYDGFERPLRRGGGLGGVPAKLPNVLSRSPSFVPETYGPVVSRPSTPWPCPQSPRPHWSHHGGNGNSILGPSGAVYSTSGSSFSTGSGFVESTGFSADIDLGNVQIHVGARPPIYGTYPVDWGTSGGEWSGSSWNHGGDSIWCGSRPICRPVGCWDNGWWTWYDSVQYYGPVYGSGWYQYDPTIFYPTSVTAPETQAPALDVSTVDANDELVSIATMMIGEGRYEEASTALREYTRREPKDAGAWRWLGVSLLADRQTKEACYAFLRAYEINESLADLPLEYEAMGLDRSDLRKLCGPLLTYARVTKSASAYLLAAVLMEARGLDDQSAKLVMEAKAAGLDPMLAQRVSAGFSR